MSPPPIQIFIFVIKKELWFSRNPVCAQLRQRKTPILATSRANVGAYRYAKQAEQKFFLMLKRKIWIGRQAFLTTWRFFCCSYYELQSWNHSEFTPHFTFVSDVWFSKFRDGDSLPQSEYSEHLKFLYLPKTSYLGVSIETSCQSSYHSPIPSAVRDLNFFLHII